MIGTRAGVRAALAASCVFLLLAGNLRSAPPGGLYGDDEKDKTTGDLDSQDYWWTKYDMMMLDYAIKQRQPEGKIGLELASTQNRLNDLVKKYPNHKTLAEWKQKVDGVVAKIDPNAPRGASFNPGCPWDEANFGQAWVNFGWSKLLIEKGQVNQAQGLLQNVTYNLGLLTQTEDRLKNYPEELKKWVVETKPVAEKMYAELKAKTSH